MAIDFDDGYIDPDSEYAKNLRANRAMGDENGIYIGNCYYTHEMIEEDKRKREAANKSSAPFVGYDPFGDF